MDYKNFRPKIRSSNIVVQNAGKELLLYDLSTNRAFCLNETSAKIFEYCDGKKSILMIGNALKIEDEIVFLAVDLFQKENLLDSESENSIRKYDNVDRRKLLKGFVWNSVVALPLISSILAPKSVNAASTGLFDCSGQPIPVSGPPCRPTNCVVTCQGNDFNIVLINGCRYCQCICQ